MHSAFQAEGKETPVLKRPDSYVCLHAQVVGTEVKEVTTAELFKGQKVVLVGMPAAFSPTCSVRPMS